MTEQSWEHEPCGCDVDKAYDDGVKKGARDMQERCAEYVEALEPAESHAKADVARGLRGLEL